MQAIDNALLLLLLAIHIIHLLSHCLAVVSLYCVEFSGNIIASWIVCETGYIKNWADRENNSHLWHKVQTYSRLHTHSPIRVVRCIVALQWRHNGRCDVSNHRRLDCLLNRLFRRKSKKTSKLRVTGFCEGNSPVNSPHKGPVTRKMFPFDDVIMILSFALHCVLSNRPKRNEEDCMTFQTKLPLKSGWYNRRVHLGLHPANERRRYKVTPSVIGWAQT